MAEEETERQSDPLLEARRIRAAFQDLLKSEGWARLVEILDDNVEERKNRVLTTVVGHTLSNGQVHTLEVENFLKGEAAAFMWIKDLPQSILDSAEGEIQLRTRMETGDGRQG